MAPPIILIPPSEGKAAGGRGAPWAAGTMGFSELDESRRLVATALQTAMADSEPALAKLLGVKGEALAAARSVNERVLTAGSKRAIDRYTGVLYDALDHHTLDATSHRRLNRQVIVFSALWGLVRPNDSIPDYKLKMSASLDGIGRLSTFWRPLLGEALAQQTNRKVVWDLLPNEHSSAWRPPANSYRARISVRFLDDVADGKGRKLITVSHWNKLLKGALVRHVLATQLSDPDGLTRFEHPLGYVYDPSLTRTLPGGGTPPTVEVSLVARR